MAKKPVALFEVINKQKAPPRSAPASWTTTPRAPTPAAAPPSGDGDVAPTGGAFDAIRRAAASFREGRAQGRQRRDERRQRRAAAQLLAREVAAARAEMDAQKSQQRRAEAVSRREAKRADADARRAELEARKLERAERDAAAEVERLEAERRDAEARAGRERVARERAAAEAALEAERDAADAAEQAERRARERESARALEAERREAEALRRAAEVERAEADARERADREAAEREARRDAARAEAESRGEAFDDDAFDAQERARAEAAQAAEAADTAERAESDRREAEDRAADGAARPAAAYPADAVAYDEPHALDDARADARADAGAGYVAAGSPGGIGRGVPPESPDDGAAAPGHRPVALRIDRDRRAMFVRSTWLAASLAGGAAAAAALAAVSIAFALGRWSAGDGVTDGPPDDGTAEVAPGTAAAAASGDDVRTADPRPAVADLGNGALPTVAGPAPARPAGSPTPPVARPPAPPPPADGRTVGAQYVVIQSYPDEPNARAARELLTANGIDATVEDGLVGYTSWYAVLGTRAFETTRGSRDYDAYVARVREIGRVYARKFNVKNFDDPALYTWRAQAR